MPNQDFTLKSGAVLHVSIPPFREALALLKALTTASAGMPSTEDIARAFLSSSEAEHAVHKCFARCTYDGQRLTEELLDDPKYTERLRLDYVEICSRVIEVTCGPFLGQTSSASNGAGPIPRAVQR